MVLLICCCQDDLWFYFKSEGNGGNLTFFFSCSFFFDLPTTLFLGLMINSKFSLEASIDISASEMHILSEF